MSTSYDSHLNIIVEKNPSDARLSELGIKFWPKWGCPPGKITLKYDATETCYFVRGKVRAFPKRSDVKNNTTTTSDDNVVEFGAGDLVIIPKGFSCTWDVSVAVDKYYKFDPPS
ncbi:hypothetical protein vseg_009776 [Gypsophila vaccaria]